MNKLKELLRIYGYYHIWIGAVHVFSIASFFFIDWIYFAYGLIFYLLARPFYEIIFHEYISHEQIKPRNDVIDLILLVLYYIHGQTVRNKRAYHVTHHVNYKNPNQDPTQLKIQAAGNEFRYIFNLQRPVNQDLLPVKNTLYETNRWVKILEPHALKITWCYKISMFVFLPLGWFMALVLYFSWLNTISYNLHDIYFHGRAGGKDRSWYVFFWGCQAWHLRHHEHPDEPYFGPKIWKYLNLSYWFYLLLFVPNTKSLKT